MKPWKMLSSELLVDAPWLKVAKEKCALPNGKIIDDFYTLWQPDWVMILPRTKDNKWVMTKQYRHGTQKIALEFPAGIIDKGETPELAAIRELQEECGYTLGERRETKDESGSTGSPILTRDDSDERVTLSEASKMRSRMGLDSSTPLRFAQNDTDFITYLGNFTVNPDRHRGHFHVVFIDGVEHLSQTHFDDTEDIETLTLTDEELQAKIADGTFDHPLQIAGYFKWKLTQK